MCKFKCMRMMHSFPFPCGSCYWSSQFPSSGLSNGQCKGRLWMSFDESGSKDIVEINYFGISLRSRVQASVQRVILHSGNQGFYIQGRLGIRTEFMCEPQCTRMMHRFSFSLWKLLLIESSFQALDFQQIMQRSVMSAYQDHSLPNQSQDLSSRTFGYP